MPETKSSTESAEVDGESNPLETRNLLALALHQIVLRIGWIFKTETVIMPSFVDMIAGPAWVRGCLPVLNRLGQSVPQFLFADRLRSMPLKRKLVGVGALLMAAPFLIMAGLLCVPGSVGSVWLPAVFLVLYLFFFSMVGLNQLAFRTITGKLISANRRGRLAAVSGVIGVTLSIIAAWNLLPGWLEMENGGFVYIFTFVGTGFVLAAVATLFIKEAPDEIAVRRRLHPFADGWRRVRSDRHLSRLLVVAALFVSTLLLVPHYQALARDGRLDFSELMVWVVAQNASAGLIAVGAGFIADRYGNRLSMRLLILLTACCPLVAVGLTLAGRKDLFVITFIMFGAIPNTFRSLENYCLELTEPDRHAQYVSTLKLFMPVILLLAPFAGWLIDLVGYWPVFVAIAILNLLGVVMTFFIEEPRHWS